MGSDPWSFQSGVSWWSCSFSSGPNNILWEKILWDVRLGLSADLGDSVRVYTIYSNRVRPYDLNAPNNLLYTVLYTIHSIL